jgi:hypothetical protein
MQASASTPALGSTTFASRLGHGFIGGHDFSTRGSLVVVAKMPRPRPTSAADLRRARTFSAPLHQQRPRPKSATTPKTVDVGMPPPPDFSTRVTYMPPMATTRGRPASAAVVRQHRPDSAPLSRPTRPASAAALRSTTASSASLLARPASAAALLGRRPAPRPSPAPPPHSLLAARRALGGGWQLAATIAEADEMEDDLKASLPALRAALSRGVAYAPRPAAAPAADAVAGAAAGSPPPQSTFGMFAMGPPGADASLLPCSMLPRSAGGATTDAAAASDPRAEAARHIARTEVDSMVGRVLDSLAPLILDDGAAVPLAPAAAAPAPAALAPATATAGRAEYLRKPPPSRGASRPTSAGPQRSQVPAQRPTTSRPGSASHRTVQWGAAPAPVPAPAATTRPNRFAAAVAPAAAPADAAPAEPPPPPALSPRSAAAAAYDIL